MNRDWDALLKFDRAHVWHPYAPLKDAPPVYPVRAARGVRLELADGRTVIDGMASWWCAIHGYRVPELDRAVQGQLEAMAHVMFGGLTHEPAVRLAERLLEIAPGDFEAVFFADSGSVSVEVAIKMALQYWQAAGRPGRRRLLTIRHGYHGDTFAAMSVCDPVTGMHHLFRGVLPEQIFAEAPSARTDAEFGEQDIADFRDKLERHADEIAAVILEPIVQGAGGMRFYAPEFLRRVRALCDAHQVLLILDEIATGFGRTGTLFACEQAGIAPDILCVGKALTGGYMTLAAVLANRRVVEGIHAGAGVLMHGPTFMANPLACSVALASIDLLLGSPWRERIRNIERGLARGLAGLRDAPGVRDVRVLGAIGVVEMERPVDVPAVQRRLIELGVWLRPFGRLLYTMPPYVIAPDELDQLTGAMGTVVREGIAG